MPDDVAGPNSSDIRQCSRCHQTLDRAQFSPRRDRPSGVQSRCKACLAEVARQRLKEARDQAGPQPRGRGRQVATVNDGKECLTCGQWKPLSSFWVKKKRHLSPQRQAGRPPGLPTEQEAYLSSRCKACMRPHRLDYHRFTRYGLTPEAFSKLLQAQQGRCAICSRPAIAVDYDHVTLRVRGLLCRQHNTGLGYFHDSVEELLSAVAYLRAH